MVKKDYFKISNKRFTSRLIVGTGKYRNFSECASAVKASGAEIVTVAVRRVNIIDKKKPLLMDYLNPKKITYLPNTAGCFNSRDALRTLRLAREIGAWNLVKLEILGDKKTLLPDMIETLKSTEVLSKEGFKVMVYCNDDPLMAKRLENVGAVAIMPLASPIGSGLGIQNRLNIKIIKKKIKISPTNRILSTIDTLDPLNMSDDESELEENYKLTGKYNKISYTQVRDSVNNLYYDESEYYSSAMDILAVIWVFKVDANAQKNV